MRHPRLPKLPKFFAPVAAAVAGLAALGAAVAVFSRRRLRLRLSERVWGTLIVVAIVLIVVAVAWPSHPQVFKDVDDEETASVTAEAADGTAGGTAVTEVIAQPAPHEDGCLNPYFPAAKGYRLEYGSITGNKVSPAFTTVIDEQNGNGLVESFDIGGERRRVEMSCQDGNIVPRQYVDLTAAFGGQRLSLPTREVSGMLLPQNPVKGKAWSLRYVVTAKATDARLLAAGLKDVDFVIEEAHKVVSGDHDVLTSPAGTFEVVRVQVDQTVTPQVPVGIGVKVEPVKRTYFASYGRHAGLLRLMENGKWDLVVTKAFAK